MNIYQKMSAITSEIGVVAKNLNVSTGAGNYKAVSELDVLNAVKPLEAKHGVYSYPYVRKIISQEEVKTTRMKNGKTVESYQRLFRIEVTYRFVNTEKPDEYVDVISYGDGLDTGDKAPGKACTYADKYALMKAYKIQTGDDPDKEASPENVINVGILNDFLVSRSVLSELGADFEDKTVHDYICEKARVNSLDPGTLNAEEMKRASQVMKELAKIKRKQMNEIDSTK